MLSGPRETEESSTTLEFDESEINLDSKVLSDILADAESVEDAPGVTTDVDMVAKEDGGGGFVLGKWVA